MGEAKTNREKLVLLQLPSTWEVFEAVDKIGGFVQLAANLSSEDQAKAAFDAFRSHPDFLNKGRKLFIVEVERRAVKANFDPGELGVIKTGVTRQ